MTQKASGCFLIRRKLCQMATLVQDSLHYSNNQHFTPLEAAPQAGQNFPDFSQWRNF